MKGFRFWHELTLVMLVLIVLGAARGLDPLFLSWEVQRELSTHVWEIAILAIPMTMIIITAGIDLSIGGMMALCAISLGMLYQAGVSPWLAAIAGTFVATFCGVFNGWMITRIKVHPLIVTLATMAAFRGAAEGISQAKPVSGLPDSFAWLGQGELMGMPVPAWIFLAFFVLACCFLLLTPWGKYCYAVGFNPVACRFSGVAVDRLLLGLYAFSGFSSGVAAVLFVARRNTAKADIGMGIELLVITAVVIGGVSIFGGRGHLIGTALGVLLIHETREFVSWRWNRDELNFIVIGSLLILSVLLQRLLSPRAKRAQLDWSDL